MCGRMKYVPKCHMGHQHEPQVADLRRGNAVVEAVLLNHKDEEGNPMWVKAIWQGHARLENLGVVWRGWTKALIPATTLWEGKHRIDLPEGAYVAAVARRGTHQWFLAVVTRNPYNPREEALVSHKLRKRLPLVVKRTDRGWEHIAIA